MHADLRGLRLWLRIYIPLVQAKPELVFYFLALLLILPITLLNLVRMPQLKPKDGLDLGSGSILDVGSDLWIVSESTKLRLHKLVKEGAWREPQGYHAQLSHALMCKLWRIELKTSCGALESSRRQAGQSTR